MYHNGSCHKNKAKRKIILNKMFDNEMHFSRCALYKIVGKAKTVLNLFWTHFGSF